MAATAPTSVPALVPFSSAALDSKGKPLSGETSATFLIYKDQQGGEPLFTESQIVAFDEFGRYKVQLGAANPNGLPSELFTSGEARWLEVQIAGQQPEPRALMASVPYALKAADAATLGGLPASAFVLAGSNAAVATLAPAAITPDAGTTVTTTGGSTNKVAKFSGTNTIVNSILYDNGTEVGVGTTTPSATLTVDGTMTVDGTSTFNGQFVLPATGSATASKAYNSQFIKLATSAYNSSSKSIVPPRFQLQAEATGNDSSAPNATLNLLASATTSAPVETGFYINTNGTIHFAAGQTFGAKSSGGVAFNGTSTSNTGVEGTSTTGDGVVGSTAGNTINKAGVFGTAGSVSGITGVAAGVWGDSSAQAGVEGTSKSSVGVYGQSTNSYGVEGRTDASSGVYAGVYGYSSNNLPGVKGEGTLSSGGEFIGGTNLSANATGGDGATIYGGGGFFGGNGITVYGGQGNYSGDGIVANGANNANDGGDGINAYGGSGPAGFTSGAGIYAIGGTGTSGGTAVAGDFHGDVTVTGTLSADAKDFKIDHPSDPANKFLVHASIESSEMVNIYSGNITTDELGLATVQLPAWFETLNGDLRYQLTVVGRKAQAWISQEVKGGKFQIASDATNTKVSWQITGVRQDAYAKANPLVVEQSKNPVERGFYKHPELYGQPEEKGLDWGRHPEKMRRMKAMREARMNGVKTVDATTVKSESAKAGSSMP